MDSMGQRIARKLLEQAEIWNLELTEDHAALADLIDSELARQITAKLTHVGIWQVEPDREQKWLIRESDGHHIGPEGATLCEIDLWREIERLRAELARERDAPICGDNTILDADLVGCGLPIVEPKKVFRCTDCGVPFHLQCAKKHFAKGDVLTQEMIDEQERRDRAKARAARLRKLRAIAQLAHERG